jgi:citrate synthase
VKLETLYAYVARGLIHGEAGARASGRGAASRRYAPQELEAFLARRRWNRRVVASAVSSTDGGRLLYRGRDAVALAEEGTFEDAAAVLWGEARAAAWPDVEADDVAAAVAAAGAVPSAEPLVRARVLVAALAAGESAAPTSEALEVGGRLVARLVAAFAARGGEVPAGAAKGPMAPRTSTH